MSTASNKATSAFAPTCDGCDKKRSDVRACGRDDNGAPDAPCLCFLCRKEGERKRQWSRAHGRYVPAEVLHGQS
jgi:hypothetical protein